MQKTKNGFGSAGCRLLPAAFACFWRALAVLGLLIGPKLSASDRTLTITSEPSHARVAINEGGSQYAQVCTTPCTLKYPELFFDPAGGQFADEWRKRLPVPLRADVSLEGFQPKSITMTLEREWSYKEFGKVVSRPYYYITGRSFHVLLDKQIDYLQLGSEQMGKSNFADAVISFQKAIERDSRNPTCYYMASQAYGKLGVIEEELGMLVRATSLDATRPDWFFELGGLYERADRGSDAESAFRQALSIRPDYFDAAVELGVVQSRRNDHRAAVQSFERALAIRPSADVYARLGQSYNALNDHRGVIQAYEKALAGGVSTPEIRESLAKAYFEQGQANLEPPNGAAANRAAAASSFQKAIEQAPSLGARANYLLAEADVAAGEYETAAVAYRKTIAAISQRGPETPDDYLWLGASYIAVGEYYKAVDALRTAAGRHADVDTFVLLARASTMTGDYDEAFSVADKALQIKPGDSAVLTVRCTARAGLHHYDEAIADCREAQRLDPNNAEAWYYMGLAYEEIRRPTDAGAAYDRFLALMASAKSIDAYGYFLRGNARLSLAQLRAQPTDPSPDAAIVAAIGDYQRAIQIQERFTKALFNLGIACVRLGRSAEARKHLDSLNKIKESDKDSELAAALLEAIQNMRAK